MGNFNHDTKTNCMYLDLAANGNGGEKAMLTIKALEAMRREGNMHADVVEIGPGGGSSLEAVTDYKSSECATNLPETIDYSFVELDGITSESLETARQRYAKFGQTAMIKGDARELATLVPDGADIVAASAVLHEVYSYGGGYAGVDETLREITDTLHPNGFFSYRDVFSVENASQHERVRHIYDKSWVYFAKLFLPYYLDNATHPYHHEDDKVVYEQDSRFVRPESIDPDKNLSINAPIGVLRELQRHYITLRDYCWRQGSLGFIPELEGPNANDWIDQRNGLKRVYYTPTTNRPEDELLAVMSEDAGNGLRSVDGDHFDATTDAEMARFLKNVLAGDETASETWQEWLKREGSETYVYMTIGRLLGSAALRSLEASDGKKLLLPASAQDVIVIPRGYYNRALSRQVSSPLPDAKQLILFRAYDPKKDKDEIAESLGALTEHCTKDTISRIYGPIRKAS
ncbi:MAG TPA: methyltransferase domain-containing protein [Patescibacteria group bacterium]|jgi:hypothetical protein|nr:methyltransferase domain-containing protein [Patescibacteria group bacterium]